MRHQDTQRWESLTLDKYLAKKPRAGMLRYGTLDLCAQGLSCQYMDEENILQGFEVICRPVVCQAGSASCIYSAVQEAVPAVFGAAHESDSRRVWHADTSTAYGRGAT